MSTPEDPTPPPAGAAGPADARAGAGAGPARPMASADAVRAVFRTALRDMVVLVLVVAVLGVAVGAVIAGTPGVWGALLGVGMTLLFSGTTVLTMLRTAGSSVTTTAAVVMGGWLAKMIALIALLVIIQDMDFYHRGVLVAVLLVGVVGSALLDYRAVQRGRVPYADPGAETVH